MGVWRVANRFLTMVNDLDRGLRTRQAPRRVTRTPSRRLLAAWDSSHRDALAEASRSERQRRGLTAPTGAQAVHTLIKSSVVDGSYVKPLVRLARIPLLASAVDEPSDPRCVFMLDVLPEEDSLYYSCESNVTDYDSKSETIFNEIEDRHTFIGGSEREYLAYLLRTDLPQGDFPLWRFVGLDEVRAYAGLTVVAKKAEGRQRKILMQCAANYIWQDISTRSNQGLHGGSALGAMHAPSDEWSIATFDEDNAFTRVATPPWMHLWCCGPPVLALLVWNLLSDTLKAVTAPWHFVAPAYCRLAMGSSHAVAILMSINLCVIGRALVGSRRLCYRRQVCVSASKAADVM